MQKTLLLFILSSCISLLAAAQIKVSENNRFLTTKDGKPFFWLADTDWELFHRLNRKEAQEFLEIRKRQGFNLLQAVALAELNGIREPNRQGDLPLINDDPTRLAITPGADPSDKGQYDYWDHVDFIINLAAEKGIYIGLLPTWGDKVTPKWGAGPLIFTPKNAQVYATTLARRYAKHWNVIWILGGDRPPVYTSSREGTKKNYDQRSIWQAMARGIESVLGKEAFITYHPSAGEKSSSKYLHQEKWLDMNAFQSGHESREADAWNSVVRDLALSPQKPTLDMEPCYEDHPVNPWDGKWTRQRGYFIAHDVRARIHRGVFAGACGVTYGHHQVWQFVNQDIYAPINIGDTLIGWRKAALSEGAKQMQYLKDLMLSRPYFTRISDQSIILADKGKNYVDLVYATRDAKGSYAMVYLPQNKALTIDLSKVSGTTKNIWWYNPRTGRATKEKPLKSNQGQRFTPPKEGKDWVLVIDDASKNFKAPGSCVGSVQTNLALSGSTVCLGSNGSIRIKASQAEVSYQAYINNEAISNIVEGGGDITLTIPASKLSAGKHVFTIQASACNAAMLTNKATIVVNNCAVSNCTASGSILREYWANVKGNIISSIPVNSGPTFTSQLSSFEAPANQADSYGQRVRGYICVPASGNYTFYIAADSKADLYLSTDADPAKKTRIAYAGKWTGVRQWNKYASQKSVAITLQAGKKYYIEALHKEGSGADHLSVGWHMPKSATISVIPGSVLSPFTSSTARLATEEVIDEVSSFTAYPNPFEDKLNVGLAGIAGKVVVTLTDVAGKQHYHTIKQVTSTQEQLELDLSRLKAGMYLLRVQHANGSSQIIRVVKK